MPRGRDRGRQSARHGVAVGPPEASRTSKERYGSRCHQKEEREFLTAIRKKKREFLTAHPHCLHDHSVRENERLHAQAELGAALEPVIFFTMSATV